MHNEILGYTEEKLKNLCEDIITQSKKLGAESAEVDVSIASGKNLTVRNEDVETFEINNDKNVTLTLYQNGRKSVVSSSDFSKKTIQHLIDNSINMLKVTEQDPYFGIVEQDLHPKQTRPVDIFYPQELSFDEMLDVADGVMVARGDLGVQLPLEQVPFVQKQILDAANKRGKISITATEMLQSMKTSYRPTRAEVTDITNAILEGSDAVMLSAETSIGDNPNRVVEVMSIICKETDSRNDTSSLLSKEDSKEDSITTTLARAAVQVANEIDATSIIAFTETGRTPLLISNFRPKAEIITFSTKKKTLNQMNLLWGVDQYPIERKETFSEMLKAANDFLISEKKYNKGDKVVVVAGTPPNIEAATNLIRVHKIGDL